MGMGYWALGTGLWPESDAGSAPNAICISRPLRPAAQRPEPGALVQVPLQLRLDAARVLALCDRDHPFDDHLACFAHRLNRDLQLACGREEEQVRETDPVDRGDERGGNALAELEIGRSTRLNSSHVKISY